MGYLKVGASVLGTLAMTPVVGMYLMGSNPDPTDPDAASPEAALAMTPQVLLERAKNKVKDRAHETITGEQRLPDRECTKSDPLVLEDLVLDVREEGTPGIVGKSMCELVLENVTIKAKVGIDLSGISWAVLRNVTIESEGPALKISGQSKVKIVGGTFTSTGAEVITLSSLSKLSVKDATLHSHTSPVVGLASLSKATIETSHLTGTRTFRRSSGMPKGKVDEATTFVKVASQKKKKKKRRRKR